MTMADEKKQPPKSEEKPKGFFGRLKEASEDKEEQLAILSTFVRLGILVWSGGILTLAYVDLPKALNFPEQDLDPTFIASVFTGVLASFGIQTAKNKNANGGGAKAPAPISKADMEKLIEKAANTAPAQTIRIEQAPMVLAPTPNKKA